MGVEQNAGAAPTAPLPAALAVDACRRVLTRLQTPSDLRTLDAAVARDLSDVLIRAYVDAPDDGMRNGALDVIDDAMKLDLYGTDRLLLEHALGHAAGGDQDHRQAAARVCTLADEVEVGQTRVAVVGTEVTDLPEPMR